MNDNIRERVGVAPVVEKMVETRHRLFGYVERRHVDSLVRRADQIKGSNSLEADKDLEKLLRKT